MALLTLVQRFCKRQGLSSPSTVYGSTDVRIQQILGILEEEGNELAGRGFWEGLTFEASHTTIAAEDQGAITSIATNGFRAIKPRTFWDRTNKLPVVGGLDSAEWQALKAVVSTSPRYRFRLRGGKLLVNPTPSAGYNWRFEYSSNNWITDSTGVTYRQYFSADTDLMLLPEDVLLMGLRWRYKKEKGLEYAEDFRTYEKMVVDALGRDGAKVNLHMDEQGDRDLQPGIFVPEGSWSL